MLEHCTFYIKTEVYDCKQEEKESWMKPEFRVFHTGGSCKSNIPIKGKGIYRLKVKPIAIKDNFYIRILEIVSKIKECS